MFVFLKCPVIALFSGHFLFSFFVVVFSPSFLSFCFFPFSVILRGGYPPKNPEITNAQAWILRSWYALRMTPQPSVIPAEAGISSKSVLFSKMPDQVGHDREYGHSCESENLFEVFSIFLNNTIPPFWPVNMGFIGQKEKIQKEGVKTSDKARQ